jgi:acyl-CoA-binding protein
MQEDFDSAAERIKPVTGPNNDEMLELYGLFKQATVGDNNTRKPCWHNKKVGFQQTTDVGQTDVPSSAANSTAAALISQRNSIMTCSHEVWCFG